MSHVGVGIGGKGSIFLCAVIEVSHVVEMSYLKTNRSVSITAQGKMYRSPPTPTPAYDTYAHPLQIMSWAMALGWVISALQFWRKIAVERRRERGDYVGRKM